jgi:DNA-binding transcriptional regulator LsrR (DeoR family)
METEERLRLLADVAELYYVRGLKQSEIARERGFSRSAISRLLTEARDRKIIEIKINHPLQRATELERRLVNTFNLQSAFVVNRGISDYQTMLRQLGKLGAAYIEDNLSDHGVLAVAWGTASYEVASALKPRQKPGCTVVQMLGAIGKISPHIDGNELVRTMASTLGARYQILHSPLVVESVSMRNALLKEGHIRDTLALAMQAEIAVVGIGSIDPEVSSLLRSGYLSPEELIELTEQGAVGDIAANHYDMNGEVLDIDINQRAICVNISELIKTHCKIIGIAGGKRKALTILGALRGGLVHILVTDSVAAEDLLKLNRKNGRAIL